MDPATDATMPPPAPADAAASPSDARAAPAIPVDGMIESQTPPPKASTGHSFKLGIDEAGRGPVLGAMTFGTCYWALDDDAAIERDQKAIDDSKQLSEEQRSKLFRRIREDARMGWAVEVVSAARLSAEMLRQKPTSLNAISFDATCRLIRRVLDRGVDVVEAYVDTVGDPDTYRDRLNRAFDGRVAFTVAKKADALYKCTGAASICAKVARDESLDAWVFEEPGVVDRGFGSGYPSDDVCKQWLRRTVHPVFGYPTLCRFSWAPAKLRLREVEDKDATAAAAAALPVAVSAVKWDDGDEDAAVANTMKITEWATVSKKKDGAPARKKRKRAHFFKKLESVTNLGEL
mmetsp:Transcript_215/g.574  ORF Transcript_215/g.574 Transcript_215/m.574 type:complete len:347 (-) Transcript_215:33-1073(-)